MLLAKSPNSEAENSRVQIRGEVVSVIAYIVAKNIRSISDISLGSYQMKLTCDYWGQNLLEEVPDEGKEDVFEEAGQYHPVMLTRVKDVAAADSQPAGHTLAFKFSI